MLTLWNSKIGDEGMRHLGDALARGAAPALYCLTLGLDSEPAKALKKLCGDRMLDGPFLVAHLADAKELRCSNLGWGDEEARRLAAALRHAHTHGALKALETLELIDNEIGDEGMRHLGDALANGAAPALKYLHLFGNPASDAAQQAVKDALENRSK